MIKKPKKTTAKKTTRAIKKGIKKSAKKTVVKVKKVATKEGKPVKRQQSKATAPLIVEPHPRDYIGLPFLTLIQYRKQPMLVIVDNADDETIKAFVLDLCGPEEVDEEMVIRTAMEWFQTNRQNYPVSVEFSKLGLTAQTSKIYRSLNVEFVSRVIGPVTKFAMSGVTSVKRRRRKAIPIGIELSRHLNVISAEEFSAIASAT